MISECIIVSKNIDGKSVLAKNRDRAYKPTLEVVHTLIDDVEVAYLRDMITDWSEGMNEYGIGVINSALAVGRDELEHKLLQKSGKKSQDGEKMREIIKQKTLKDAVRATVEFKGTPKLSIKGHTFISTPKTLVSVEIGSTPIPNLAKHDNTKPIVRTNHGHYYTQDGYTGGADFLSSKVRKSSAEKTADAVDDWTKLAPAMRKQYFPTKSALNMKRSTDKMFTSSQTIMNLTDKILEIDYLKDKVKEFKGIRNELPPGYQPKIKIVIKPV
jgi:hypothetical protein